MQQLIKDLLSFTRLTKNDKKFEPTNLETLIDEIKSDLKETLTDKKISIAAKELCPVRVIPFQFRQLLYNLINNSIKFADTDRPLRIVIKAASVKGKKVDKFNLVPEKNYCHVVYQDNGIGFDNQFQNRIFEVFQKLHNPAEFEGTGIGLAIVKKIVDNHQGIVTAQGQPGKGARFDIFIPA